jgi:Tfp pilus assembly protein PilF
MSYEDARKRARQIAEVTQKGFMPPWLPSEGPDHFAGARRLTDAEKQTLKAWSQEGAPEGDATKAPAPPTFTEGWQTGTPDLILESPAYTLAAGGGDVFRNFVVPITLTEPRWVESIELRPDNPRITHHARLGVDSSGESIRRDAEDPEPGYAGMAWGQDPDGQLVIWAPGMLATRGEPGVAWRLYPQTCLVLHTHMQPSGKPEVMKFRIGVHFAKEAPTQHPVMMRIGSCDIDIPAGAAHHVVTDQYTLPIDVDVHTIFPHAHSLCTQLSLVAEKPDGSRTGLITIDHFDENWHDSYRCTTPIRLPKGTRILSTFTYDNTDQNIKNRSHPARRVGYGSNVTDEMADTYLQVTPVHPDQREALMEDYKRYELASQITGSLRTLALDPANTFSQEALAAYYTAQGQPQKAIPVLEARLKLGKREVFPVVSLGMALLAAGDAPRAEASLRDATALDPKYPLAWLGLARALAAEKKPDDAELCYRRAAELAPGMLDASLALADVLIAKARYADAEEACTAALAQSPDTAATYLKLAEIAARQLNYDASLNYCKKAREAAPYTHPPKVLVAVFANANADAARATKLLQEARAEEPTHPMAPLMLAQLAMQRQQWLDARDLLAAAASLPTPDCWPQSHRRRFEILLHSTRCQLAQQLQDLDMARDALTQWMKAEPENPRLKPMLDSLSKQSR